MWRGLTSTQKLAQKLITGPGPNAKLGTVPLTGCNPGLLPASLLDVIPCEGTST